MPDIITSIATIIIDIITSIATIVLCILTGLYVRLTNKLVKATDRPEVIVFLFYEAGSGDELSSNSSPYTLCLCVQNAGKRTARNIRLIPNRDANLPTSTRETLNKMDCIQNELQLLPPEKTISDTIYSEERSIDMSNKKFYEGHTSKIDVCVKYQDSKGTKYNDNFTLDFLRPTT